MNAVHNDHDSFNVAVGGSPYAHVAVAWQQRRALLVRGSRSSKIGHRQPQLRQCIVVTWFLEKKKKGRSNIPGEEEVNGEYYPEEIGVFDEGRLRSGEEDGEESSHQMVCKSRRDG